MVYQSGCFKCLKIDCRHFEPGGEMAALMVSILGMVVSGRRAGGMGRLGPGDMAGSRGLGLSGGLL